MLTILRAYSEKVVHKDRVCVQLSVRVKYGKVLLREWYQLFISFLLCECACVRNRVCVCGGGGGGGGGGEDSDSTLKLI